MKPALFLLMSAFTGGCATRAVPASFPTGSAASIMATEAPNRSVVVSLRSEPPLPGESADDWPGLEPGAASLPSQPVPRAPEIGSIKPATATEDKRPAAEPESSGGHHHGP
jgi:hypothetical protein